MRQAVKPVKVSGTEHYAEEAPELLLRYESIAFTDAHAAILHLIPSEPCAVLDIGSGTGRDAAALAAIGHRVVAVEPTDEMRQGAIALHHSPRIEWLDDSLPNLSVVRQRGERFDLVMMTAVWMHLDEAQRRLGMPNVAGLLRAGGVMAMTLRHGPVPPGRRMFEVTAEETIALATAAGLHCLPLREAGKPSLRQPGVTWTRLAFAKAL
jgi:SAM-dependent methyltransferase